MLNKRKKLIVFFAINKYATSIGLSYLLYKKQNLFFRLSFVDLQVQMANTVLEILHKIIS